MLSPSRAAMLLIAGIVASSTLGATIAAAKPSYKCQSADDGTFGPERSCAEGSRSRRFKQPPPPPPTEEPPVLYSWRDQVLDQTLSSGGGGGGGGGNGR